MEVGNVNNIGPQKADELKEARLVRNRAVNAYAKADQKDSVDVSSKARLLHKLRDSYDKLPEAKNDQQVKEIKEKLEEGVHKLSSEEIVSSILKGSLFDVI